jgi:hypothetical protein
MPPKPKSSRGGAPPSSAAAGASMMMIRTVLDGVRNWRDTTAGLLPRVIAAAAADADQLPSGGATMDLGVYTEVLGPGRQPAAPECGWWGR